MLRATRQSRSALFVSCPTYFRSFVRKNGDLAVKRHDPLNILFCGSDEFSIASLRALSKLQDHDAAKIASIDVVCRPGKRFGRGLKQIREAPIKSVAQDLGLRLHQIDTFTGWTPPVSINLVIAVSFGLLVPPRILNAAKYGGLNVHPSLLPDLWGPAPIVHAILKSRTHTGLTLQTMHPTHFDHGAILAQTPAPGVPMPEGCTSEDHLKLVTPLGADILCEAIHKGLFVPPIKDMRAEMHDLEHLDHAPKLKTEDRRIDWQDCSAEEVLRRDRALGKLWDTQTHGRCLGEKHQGPARRVTFHGPWTVVAADSCKEDVSNVTPGHPVLVYFNSPNKPFLGIVTSDRKIVNPTAVTIESESKMGGLPGLIAGVRSTGQEAT